MGKRLNQSLSLLAGIAAVYVVITTLIGYPLNHLILPIGDLCGYATKLLMSNDGTWTNLWIQHNDHRLLTLNLALWLDIHLFSYQKWFSLTVSLLCFLSIGFLFAAMTWQYVGIEERWMCIGASFIVALTAIQSSSLYSPTGISFATVLLFSGMAFVCFSALAQSFEKNGKVSVILLTLTSLFAVLSAFSLLNGLFSSLIIAVACWRMRLPVFSKVYFTLLFIAITSVYFIDYSFIAKPKVENPDYLNRILFTLYFLGSPFHINGTLTAPIFGLIGFICSAALGLTFFTKPTLLRSKLAPFLGASMAFGSIVLISLGRAGGLDTSYALTSRYYTLSLFLWMCLFLTLLSLSSGTRNRFRFLALWTLKTALVFMLVNLVRVQWSTIHLASTASKEIRHLEIAMMVDGMKLEDYLEIFAIADTRREGLRQEINLLKDRGIMVFSTNEYKQIGDAFGIDYDPDQAIQTTLFKERTSYVSDYLFESNAVQVEGYILLKSDPLTHRVPIISNDQILGYADLKHTDSQKYHVIGYSRPPEDNAELQIVIETDRGLTNFTKVVTPTIQVVDRNSLGFDLAKYAKIAVFELSKDAAWGPQASPPEVRLYKDTPWESFASWSGSDSNQGTLSFNIDLKEQSTKPIEILLPYVTGPDSQNCSIRIKSSEETTTLFETEKLSENNGRWRYLHVTIPPHADTGRLHLEATDAGDQWGQWFAIGLPLIKKH